MAETPKWAETEINKARKERARKLEIEGFQVRDQRVKLAEVPLSLRELTHVSELSLAGNVLTELPEWLVELKDLTSLNLNFNAIGNTVEGARRSLDVISKLTKL